MQLEVAHIDFYPGQNLSTLFRLIGFNDDLEQDLVSKLLILISGAIINFRKWLMSGCP